jgi:penicillin-binding protein 1A
MWIYYMDAALGGLAEHAMQRPPGIVDVRIDPDTGLVTSDTSNGVFEKFRFDEIPDRAPETSSWRREQLGDLPPRNHDEARQPLF